MKKNISYILAFLFTLVATTVSAATASTQSLDTVAAGILGIANRLVPLIIGAAVLAFIWGIFTYLLHGDDEGKREESKQYMIWSLVGIFVMVSVWGLVYMLVHAFGLNAALSTLPTKER